MVKKSQIAATAPEAIAYVQLKLPPDIPVAVSLDDELNKEITLEIQGEAVEVSEEYPIPILMAAFNIIHKVSPEMVLRLKTSQRILLFDHWGTAVIRDKNIEIINEKIEHKKSEGFIPELVINIESVWKKTSVEENNFYAISKALKEIVGFIKPAVITTLVGKAPALLFLLVQHALYGQTGEIWYQENLAHKPIRIT